MSRGHPTDHVANDRVLDRCHVHGVPPQPQLSGDEGERRNGIDVDFRGQDLPRVRTVAEQKGVQGESGKKEIISGTRQTSSECFRANFR